jgi:hypothetical protein
VKTHRFAPTRRLLLDDENCTLSNYFVKQQQTLPQEEHSKPIFKYALRLGIFVHFTHVMDGANKMSVASIPLSIA